MSKSLIYHAFGVKATYEYIRQKFNNGSVYFTIKRPLGEVELFAFTELFLGECSVCESFLF
jgi:hypothetical protein